MVIKGRADRTSPMGANVTSDGAIFRTWAPNASSVALVAGAQLPQTQQANWSPAQEDLLEPLGDGSWGGFIAGVRDGDLYMVFIEGVGSRGWKRDPFARELSTSQSYPNSPCVVRDPASYPWHDAQWTPPAFSDLVIYQLHVGTWWACDETGADVRSTRGGTFLDVADKLDHLVSLGVNAIQLLPIQEFETSNSMGYNGVDLFSPELEYCVDATELPWRLSQANAALGALGQPGLTAAQLAPGVSQLKFLIDLCHLRGVAVILDQVYNHAYGHDDHGQFDDRSLWFYDRQTNGNPNNSLYFTDQVWIGPMFAYWNDWVSQFLIDNACSYIDEFHIDGIRYDEVSAISNHGGDLFSQRLTETVRASRPSAIQIAEYWNGDRGRAVQPPPAGLGFDAELADGLRNSLRDLLVQLRAGESAAIDLSGVAGGLLASMDRTWRLNQCLENQDLTYAGHSDAARVPVLANPADHRDWYGRSRSRAASGILMTAPGIPTIFMGEEFLEDKNWSDDRTVDGLVWWEGLWAADSSMRDFLRCLSDLVALRRAQPALQEGGIRVSQAQNFERVLVFHRWLEGAGRDVIVVASFDESPKAGYPVGLPFAGSWRVLFNSDFYDSFPNPGVVGDGAFVEAAGGPLDGFAASAQLTIPGNGVLVLGRA
jgi:1,4-alpha-glucan branching enzyme